MLNATLDTGNTAGNKTGEVAIRKVRILADRRESERRAGSAAGGEGPRGAELGRRPFVWSGLESRGLEQRSGRGSADAGSEDTGAER